MTTTSRLKRSLAFVGLAACAAYYAFLMQELSSGQSRQLSQDVANAPPIDIQPVDTSTANNNTARPPQPASTTATLPLCSRRDILDGQWVRVPPILTAADASASAVGGVLIEGKIGTAYRNGTTPNPPSDPKKHDKCTSDPIRAAESRMVYDWAVNHAGIDHCRLLPWNAHHFCSALGNRTLLFAGDSLSQEQYFSLGYLLGKLPESVRIMRNRHIVAASGLDSSFVACGRRSRIGFVLTNNLDAKRIEFALNKWQAEILVINRGAHYVPDEEVAARYRNETLPLLKRWHQGGFCRDDSSRKCRLIFRPTMPGHPHCSNHDGGPLPPNQTNIMRDTISDMSNYKSRFPKEAKWLLTHHWWDFERQNSLQESLLHEGGLDYNVLDAYDMLLLRPDMHVGRKDGKNGSDRDDCLHYCLPGPLDVLNRLLLQELVRSESISGEVGRNSTL